jgi:hypothetical protein
MRVALADVGRSLRSFADNEAAGFSPLYQHLAAHAAQDDQVADLATEVLLEAKNSVPVLFFAAAHRLVQAEPLHPLSRYYPSMGGFDGVDVETWPLFRSFVLDRSENMRKLISTSLVRNDDVRRASLLYPAVSMAAREAGAAVSLLEIGAGAGFLLSMDQFGYRYQRVGGEQILAGPTKATVGLHCAVEVAEGATFPKLPKKLRIVDRIGLDQAPADTSDEEESAWLEACVWADQPDRARLLKAAAAAQRKSSPRLVVGDPIENLLEAADGVSAQTPLVVVTSEVLSSWKRPRQQEFLDRLGKLAQYRAAAGSSEAGGLWWISLEGITEGFENLLPGSQDLDSQRNGLVDRHDATSDPVLLLSLTRWIGTVPATRLLARTTARRQRLIWLADGS